MKRAIKEHRFDFAAIITLLVLSIAVAGFVLSHEGLRFPLIQSSPFMINADFSTAKSVTPGQGQAVRVSGVQIGIINDVTLKDGLADVSMAIDSKYMHLVHTDATALLRPRTGLDDMFVELNPGRDPAPVAQAGFTIPAGSTQPTVDVDQILSSLDSESRSYLGLLVNGAGDGLKHGGGSELAQTLKRFEPLHRDLARVNGAVAQRGVALRQLVNSLQRLNTALVAKGTQIVSLVDASDRVFGAFASQDRNVSQAIAQLPGTLRQTTTTLGQVQTFAGQLGPAARNLLPAAGALPAANAALTKLAVPSAPIVRDQIRPFVVAAQPLVRNLHPAANLLAAATPNLGKVFTVLGHLVNLLGYNPGNQIHGYLWWLAWADHNARSLFSTQDANGDLRNLFLQANCASLSQIANSFTGGETLLNLTPILTNAGLCPKQAAASTAAYKRYQQGRLPARAPAAGSAKVPFLPKLPVN